MIDNNNIIIVRKCNHMVAIKSNNYEIEIENR